METIEDWHEPIDQSDHPAVCIYCDGSPLTKEHIFPRWLRETIGGTVPAFLDHGQGFDETGKPIYTSSKQKAGTGIDWQPKIVCAVCNNGWMSEIQQRAKPSLIQFLNGCPDQSDLNSYALAHWAIMFSISAEQLSPGNRVIRKTDKLHIRASNLDLSRWCVWYGRFSGSMRNFNWRANSLKAQTTPDPFGPLIGVRSTAITFGRGIILCLYVNLPWFRADSWSFPFEKGLDRLFPFYPKMSGSPLVVYNDKAFEALADWPVYRTQQRLEELQGAAPVMSP